MTNEHREIQIKRNNPMEKVIVDIGQLPRELLEKMYREIQANKAKSKPSKKKGERHSP